MTEKQKQDTTDAQDKAKAAQLAKQEADEKAKQEADEKAKQEADDKAKSKGKGKGQVRAVYGDIIDLETGHTYTTTPSAVHVENGWLDMQISAGKIERVE